MAINDTRAIRFCNEAIRPTAERLRALKNDVDNILLAWASVSALFPNLAIEAVEDGRTTEGISILTGQDVNRLITQLQGYETKLNQAGIAAAVAKPCVRAF